MGSKRPQVLELELLFLVCALAFYVLGTYPVVGFPIAMKRQHTESSCTVTRRSVDQSIHLQLEQDFPILGQNVGRMPLKRRVRTYMPQSSSHQSIYLDHIVHHE